MWLRIGLHDRTTNEKDVTPGETSAFIPTRIAARAPLNPLNGSRTVAESR
jgi:hypothetical protein